MDHLADLLLEQGLVDRATLAAALAEQQRAGRSLGRILVEHGALTEAQLVETLAHQAGLPFVDLAEYDVEVAALALVPVALCRRHAVLPIGIVDGRLLLAMADPADVVVLDDIRSRTGLEPRPVVAVRDDLVAAISRYHRAESDLDTLGNSLEEEPDAHEALPLHVEDDGPVVRYVDLVIAQAVQDRASDIHLEPTERDLRVRFRIDGVLHDVMRSPRSIAQGVLSRLKIMADLDIAERRVPQDGRISVRHHGRSVDLRVATLPTVWGEKVVMRILDNATATLALDDLGFARENHERFRAAVGRPYGMVLVTGPTGSGKSTTLYAALNVVSRPEINVITVEDPVEYRLPGINQVQVNVRAGMTFAAALRSILRCDPDVVLLGEIRDEETARIATEAALTGHLVLSTLHTNDAPSAVTRLTEMGVEPFLVSSALACVVGQRLARRLCKRCAVPVEPGPDDLALLAPVLADREEPLQLRRAVGCPACARTGYTGRLALHEVMGVDAEVERLTVARASSNEIARAARAGGMRPLREDGLAKVADGVTTVEEILRVVA